MNTELSFSVNTIGFDEHYQPQEKTRLTTNFANLARGSKRQQNLRNTLKMINNRFNSLAYWDNPNGDRYSVAVDIVSFDLIIKASGEQFPMIEMLQASIVDHRDNQIINGMFGNSFSSYVRDYDFSVLQSCYPDQLDQHVIGDGFGDLHGKLFKHLLKSEVYTRTADKPPVICLSVSSSKTYSKTANSHPVLGAEFLQSEYSHTDAYFAKMGLQVRYFMPPNSVAPMAFYFSGDLLRDYTHLELASAIAIMESFQKIYRPEIYNANAPAGRCFTPSLQNPDHSLTNIMYDRQERSELAVAQGKFTEAALIVPHRDLLTRWVNHH